MSVVIIVQARMTSTRLPGKVLLPVLDKPLLAYQLERLQRCQRAEQLIVATTRNTTDDPVAALCQSLNIRVFRGDEADVLGRYAEAATLAQADTVVRITADCPLIDPAVIDSVIAAYQAEPGRYDYVSNTQTRTFPRGMDAEVFSAQALQEAAREATLPAQREHVTPFFYQQPQRYRLGEVRCDTPLGHHRWTVDTPEDFELIRRILTTLYPETPRFTMTDVVALLDQHPDWRALNAHIEQVSVPPMLLQPEGI